MTLMTIITIVGLSHSFIIQPVFVILALTHDDFCMPHTLVTIIKYFEILLPFIFAITICFILVFLANDSQIPEK